MSTTFAVLTGVIDLADGDACLVQAYQGIRLTMIPNGGTVTYSKVDEPDTAPDPANHNTATEVDITDETTIDVAWPWYLVSVAGGTARVALV